MDKEQEPENIQVICRCGRIIATTKGIKSEQGLTCFCGLPIDTNDIK